MNSPAAKETSTVKNYCIIFYLFMTERTITYDQPMDAYLFLFKFLEERLVNKCNVYLVVSCI